MKILVATWLSRVSRSGSQAPSSRTASVDPPALLARVTRVGTWLVLVGLLVGLVSVQPVAAQASNPVCSGDSGILPNMIEGFIQLTTALGLMGLIVVWQADELAAMFVQRPEKKRELKQHKRGAMKSATVLVLLGPLFTIAGSLMELPVAQCVDLVPF